MSVTLIQRETTFDVEYDHITYSVTVLEDKVSLGYTQYDVFDEDGELVEDELKEAVVCYLEEKWQD